LRWRQDGSNNVDLHDSDNDGNNGSCMQHISIFCTCIDATYIRAMRKMEFDARYGVSDANTHSCYLFNFTQETMSSMAFHGDMSSMDQFYESLGIIGGVSLSVCTIPQIMHMYRTKDARDLQKRFLILYLTGTIFTFVYLVVKDAWAAWVTMTLEVNAVYINCVSRRYS
jgi:uncharacterized protein with PQ loop repeat